MKSYMVIAGTVILGTLNAGGKERLNLQQVMVVTPRTAEALGLSYENLWQALQVASVVPHGSPIVVRLASEKAPVVALTGAVAQLSLEKAALAVDKNGFVRS